MMSKFAGLSIDLIGLGKVRLTEVFKQTTETTLYRVTYPGIIVKMFDLACGKPGEISYGPYMRFTLELANFEDIMNLEGPRRCVPVYYGASINYEKQYAYIAMEFLEGQDLQSWCDEGSAAGYQNEWVRDFKQSIYEALSIMTQFHHHGIILVDFKPDNIIRGSQRGVKFVDLGAFFTPRHHSATDKYLYSATPDYAELLIDASNIQTGIPPSEASDIFSVGVALFEMATGASRLEIQAETADEILSKPAMFRFRDSQIRDLWKEFPHLKELFPSVETQLRERRILFSELWHLLKGYLSEKVADWESVPPDQRDQIILTTGTTFILEQLPAGLEWLAGPIAHSTVLRSIRLKTVADLMKLIQNPVPESVRDDILKHNCFLQYVADFERPIAFAEQLNTWETRWNPLNSHWTISAPVAFAQLRDSAMFTFLKQVFVDPEGHRYLHVVSDFEADDFQSGKLTLAQLQDDHFAWLA